MRLVEPDIRGVNKEMILGELVGGNFERDRSPSGGLGGILRNRCGDEMYARKEGNECTP
jgi:hypothetical protein